MKKLYRSSGDKDGERFPNIELFPYFKINVQPELLNNSFNDEKVSLILSRKCKRRQCTDLSVWNRWLQSTEENNFNLRWPINQLTLI